MAPETDDIPSTFVGVTPLLKPNVNPIRCVGPVPGIDKPAVPMLKEKVAVLPTTAGLGVTVGLVTAGFCCAKSEVLIAVQIKMISAVNFVLIVRND